MSIIQNGQRFIINSVNRLSGTDGSFSYYIPIDLSAGYDSVCLLGASIPKSYYLVQLGFNTFTLQENGVNAIITIPPGNYSYITWMLTVIPLLNSASPNGWTYNITYPNRSITTDTGLFTYTVSGNSSQPSIITTVNVYEQLGFALNSTNTFVGNTLTSTSVINFTPEETLLIHSDIADNKSNDILNEIYDDNTVPLSYIVYQCTSMEAYSSKLKLNSSRSFSFSLTNENNQPKDLNGRNMLLTVLVFKKETIFDLIRSLIKVKLLNSN